MHSLFTEFLVKQEEFLREITVVKHDSVGWNVLDVLEVVKGGVESSETTGELLKLVSLSKRQESRQCLSSMLNEAGVKFLMLTFVLVDVCVDVKCVK